MALARNDEYVNRVDADKALLLALKNLALVTEQHRTQVNQLQLKISIEEASPNPKQEVIQDLEFKLRDLTLIERIEAESVELLNKYKEEGFAKNASERIDAINAELCAMPGGKRFEFLLESEAKNILLCVAAYYGLNDTLAFLLANGASTTAVIDSTKSYPFSLDAGIPRFLDQLNLGIELVRLQMSPALTNRYPLELALAGKHLVAAEKLVAAKANVNATFSNKPSLQLRWSQNPPTLLFAEAEQGNIFSVDFLIAHGADLNATDKYGNTALHRAAFGNHMAVVQSLLHAQANPNIRAKGNNGNRTAADFGSPEIRAVIKTYQDKSCTATCAIM